MRTTASPPSNNSGDNGKGEVISGITHDPALDGQPKGPTVCKEASDGQCNAGQNNGQGGGSEGDEGTPPNNSGPAQQREDRRRGGHPTGDPDHGSIATGVEHSGRDVAAPGKGKSGKD